MQQIWQERISNGKHLLGLTIGFQSITERILCHISTMRKDFPPTLEKLSPTNVSGKQSQQHQQAMNTTLLME